MDFENFLLLATTIINIVLAFIVYGKNKKNWINISFAGFALSIAVWSLVLAGYRQTEDENLALWWMKFSYVAAASIAAFFWTFSLKFPKNKKISFRGRLLIIISAFVMFFLLLHPDFLIKAIENNSWGKEIILDKLHHTIFSVYFIFFFFGGLLRILKKYLQYSGIIKMQLLYILLSVFIAGSFGVFFNLILPSPWISSHKYVWLGPLFTAIIVASIAYAMAKYRFLDIRVVIKRSVIFTFLVIICTAIFVVGAVLVAQFLEEPFTGNTLVLGSFLFSIIIVLGLQPLKKFLQDSTDKFLFVKDYEPQKFLGEMGDLLGATLDPTRLYQIVMTRLDNIFHYKSSSILLLDKTQKKYAVVKCFGDKKELCNQLQASSPLIKYVTIRKSVIVSEELLRKYSQSGNEKKMPNHLRAIKETGASVIVPMFSKQLLIGLMFLGDKKSGDIYTNEDLNVIEIVSNQASISIVNAQLYEEMRNFNLKLKEEVTRATVNLRKANLELKKLDQAKSEFISIASHQLRTPLTIIKGYISMMLEGSFGKLTENERHSLDKVYASNERLIKLVDDLLNISRIESGRLEYNFELADLDEIIHSLVDQFKPTAKKKKIYLDYIRPEKPLDPVSVDLVKIKEVISNLVDNAIKYTKRGGVRAWVKEEKKMIIFCVADTGAGMSREERKNLFKKFTRGKGKSLLHTEGSGLGLYVARKLLEAHKGKIWGESKGKSKGSKFCFSLPIAKK